MSGYPILVYAEQIVAVVVGGGAVGTRKAMMLVESGATVRVIAPEIADELEALAAREPRLRLVRRTYTPGDVIDADLVLAATSDRAANVAIAADARALHRLVTVANAPDVGTFAGMAVHRADDVVIAVSAGGVPGAAARIRDAVASLFGPAFGEAIGALSAMRERLLRDGKRSRWRAASAALLDDGFCEDVRSGRFMARVAQWR